MSAGPSATRTTPPTFPPSGTRASRPFTATSRTSTPGSPAASGSPTATRPLDPYALVFYAWGKRRELPAAELKNYTAFKDRMLQRDAVKRVVENEKVKV